MTASAVLDLDRRRSDRLATSLRACLRRDDVSSHTASVDVLDISHSGLRIKTEREHFIGSKVLVDLECEVPLQVHLGFDVDSLVVNGPMYRQLVQVAGYVTHAEADLASNWNLGISFCEQESDPLELEQIYTYIDYLLDQDSL